MKSTAEQVGKSDGEWWIVDNNSPDDSVEVLSQAAAEFSNVQVIVSDKNGGFGYGNNQVIRRVLSGEIQADFLYFLNPDASPEDDSIRAMMSYLDEHQDVGIVGSGLLNEDGSHTDSMFRFPTMLSEIESSLVFGPVSRLLRGHRQSLGELERPGPVDWVAGTSFMAKSELFRRIGGFDEDFFLYWEEVELCHRAKRAGFAVHALPTARVIHVGGVSTGMHREERRLPGYWHQSRNLYFRKTGTGGPLWLLNAVTAACISIRRAIDFIKGRPAAHPGLLRDHVKHAIQDGRR